MRTRLHSGDRDTRAIQSLASRAWPAGWHPGGLGWALARGELGQQVLLLDDDAGRMVGWAAFGQHGAGDVLAQAGEDAAPALVAWLLDNVDAPRLSLEVNDNDEPLARAAQRAGFRADPGTRVPGMFCDVQQRADVPTAGFEVRAVRDDEFEPRVAVHRAAWRPASLPWMDGREVDASGESKFDAAA
jgi:hypothetical protein